MDWNKAGEIFILCDKVGDKTYSLDPISFMVWVPATARPT